MSSVTLGEVLVHPMRLGREAEAEGRIERLGIGLVDADRAVARGAARLRAQYPGLRTPDAFVLATAQETVAEPVTFDERLGRVISRL
jgi:predicted nucleic acid-binding protein